MSMQCNVCGSDLGVPIYESESARSLTSLCELADARARVWSCAVCSHLRSPRMPDQAAYYATEYRISLGADDEDQIYEVRGDQVVYRTEHQIDTLFARLDPKHGALMLDYGCAKAAGPQRILQRRPDIVMHLFDVSDMYRDHWKRLVPLDRTAVDETTPEWQERFDIVTSFFAIEHMEEPRIVVARMAALLKAGGTLYGIVPDTFGNVADFVVSDHVNHFTHPSLSRLLASCGFGDLAIDASAHRGALVFTARKGAPSSQTNDAVAPVREQSLRLADYWRGLGSRLRASEERLASLPTAIYGAGFYGSWICSALSRPEQIRCFLDRSPFEQGRRRFGKPIVRPDQLPDDVGALYVGLNPAIARDTLANATFLERRKVELVFLDGAGA
jgi:SAM-dependent methyltransferase